MTGQGDGARMVDAAARAAGRPAGRGVVVRRGRSTLIQFDDLLARVRYAADRPHAEREAAVGQLLAAVGVPAVRPVSADRCLSDVDGFAITVWQWIDGLGRAAPPDAIGRLAVALHAATAVQPRAASSVVGRPPISAFDPVAATRELLVGDPSDDAHWLTALVDGLAESWDATRSADPLGASLVHGDLHAENVLLTAAGPVLVDLELTGVGPPSYDAAPMAVAVHRYGADPSSLDAFLASWPADPREWAGFAVCCQVYETWVTAWAVSQRARSPAANDEAGVRVAALRGGPSRAWTLQ